MGIHEERHPDVPVTRDKQNHCVPCWRLSSRRKPSYRHHGARQERYRGTAKGQQAELRNQANRRGA